MDFCPHPALGKDSEAVLAVLDDEGVCNVVDWRTGGQIKAPVALEGTPVGEGHGPSMPCSSHRCPLTLLLDLPIERPPSVSSSLHVLSLSRMTLRLDWQHVPCSQLQGGSIRRLRFSRASDVPVLFLLVVHSRKSYVARFDVERSKGKKAITLSYRSSSLVVSDVATSFDLGRGRDVLAVGTGEGEVMVFR